MRIHKGEKPTTKILDERNAIEVELISWPDIKQTKKMLVQTCHGYSNVVDYDNMSEQDRDETLKQIVSNNTLPKSAEMTGKFVFLVKNISLTITHCLVRHRFFTILQKSTAVNDLRNENFVMPRSLARDKDFYNDVLNWYKLGKELFCEAVDNHNVSVQDARVLIPKNNCNHMFIGCDLLSLVNAYGQRVDTQEEPIQHNIIFEEMKALVLEKFPYFEKMFKSHCDSGRCLHCRPGSHTNIVFKRNEAHKKFLPDGYLDKHPDNLLHNKTRDEMSDGKEVEEVNF